MINNRKRRGKHAQIKIDKKQQHHELEKKNFLLVITHISHYMISGHFIIIIIIINIPSVNNSNRCIYIFVYVYV